jgi:hypothetical protein
MRGIGAMIGTDEMDIQIAIGMMSVIGGGEKTIDIHRKGMIATDIDEMMILLLAVMIVTDSGEGTEMTILLHVRVTVIDGEKMVHPRDGPIHAVMTN